MDSYNGLGIGRLISGEGMCRLSSTNPMGEPEVDELGRKVYCEVARRGTAPAAILWANWKKEGFIPHSVDHDRLPYSTLEKLRKIAGRGELAWSGHLQVIRCWKQFLRTALGDGKYIGMIVYETENVSNGYPVYSIYGFTRK